MINELAEKLESVQTRHDLSEFIASLLQDFKKDKPGWENTTLPSFLEAMSAWVEDMDGYYQNQGKPFSEDQLWKTFAEILYAAKMYE